MDRKGYKTLKRNDVFVPMEDFEYVIDAFKSAFPLKHPFHDRMESSFDMYGHNHFDKQTCLGILAQIARTEYEDPRIQDFVQRFTAWMMDKLAYADVMVVFGTL